jgi:hypothetical protein
VRPDRKDYCSCTTCDCRHWEGAGEVKYDPLVIDLNRDGNTDLTNNVYFDLDANGFAEATSWIDGSDGLLVMDRNGNDDGVFGNGELIFLEDAGITSI